MWLFTFLSDYCVYKLNKKNYCNLEKIFYLVFFKFLCKISTTGYSKKKSCFVGTTSSIDNIIIYFIKHIKK